MKNHFNAVYELVEQGFRKKFPLRETKPAQNSVMNGKTHHVFPIEALPVAFDMGHPVTVRRGFENAMRLFATAPSLLGENTQKWLALGLLTAYLDDPMTSPTGTVDGFALAAMEMDDEKAKDVDFTTLDQAPEKIIEASIVLAEKYNLSADIATLVARGYIFPFVTEAMSKLTKETLENPFEEGVRAVTTNASVNYALRCII